MYSQYSHKSRVNIGSILKRILYLIPIGLIVYVIHLDSRQTKQRIERILEEKDEFLGCFDISVSQAGYLKKRAGSQDIYVPSLQIRVSNLSEQEFSNLQFNALFLREGRSICQGAATMIRLNPRETKDIYLRCIDSAVFGSIVCGLNLMETTGGIEYKVSIRHWEIQATAAEGILEFNLLPP